VSDPSTVNTPDEAAPAQPAADVEETVVIAQREDGSIDIVEIVAAPDAAPAETPAGSVSAPASADPAGVVPPLHGVGPLTIRELAIGGVWLVAFVCSFFAITPGPFASIWSSGILWILTIGVPTVAVFLLLLRRFSPQGIRRVGSLGIDQFASVAFSVSAVVWVQMTWDAISFSAASGIWVRTWVLWVELVLMLAGVVLTVLAPFIPVLRDDFLGRPEQVAHPNARPVRAVEPRPAPVHHAYAYPPQQGHAAPAPDAYAPGAYSPLPDAAPAAGYAPAQASGHVSAAEHHAGAPQQYASAQAYSPEQVHAPESAYTPEPAYAESAPVTEPVHYDAFWALAPVERDVVDEYGTPIFRIGPTAWALVVEDRGAVFVVRHEDGRLGYLHDVSGVVRG
jgi:hypothetical protein